MSITTDTATITTTIITADTIIITVITDIVATSAGGLGITITSIGSATGDITETELSQISHPVAGRQLTSMASPLVIRLVASILCLERI
jgi:hypothetical protein